METGLTCRGRSCHYLRVGRRPETLMEKSTTLTTLTSAPAGSTPETGRTLASDPVPVQLYVILIGMVEISSVRTAGGMEGDHTEVCLIVGLLVLRCCSMLPWRCAAARV